MRRTLPLQLLDCDLECLDLLLLFFQRIDVLLRLSCQRGDLFGLLRVLFSEFLLLFDKLFLLLGKFLRFLSEFLLLFG